MIFTNYSQTYAANIMAIAGLVAAISAMFGVKIADAEIQFVIGTVLNFGGLIWAIVHRHSQGNVTVAGFRKDVSPS